MTVSKDTPVFDVSRFSVDCEQACGYARSLVVCCDDAQVHELSFRWLRGAGEERAVADGALL